MKNKFISALLAGCLVVGYIGPVNAEEITTADGTGTVPVELTAEALTFSVTVPTSLPVTVAADGTVTTADNAEITNNSAGPVKVKSVKVEAVAPWELVSDFADLSGEIVGENKFSFSVQDANVAADGTCAATFDVIPANDNIDFTYDVKVAPQNEATTKEQMAKVVFTLGWLEYIPFKIDGDNVAKVGFKNTKEEVLKIPATFQDTDGTWYKVTSIEDWAFSNRLNLAQVIIPDSVTSIGRLGFYASKSLTSVIIPNSVTKIEEQAFSRCTSLVSVNIPNGLTEIDYRTFYDCKGLASITIPDSVITIGQESLSKCESLTQITIPDNVKNIYSGAFDDTPLTSITYRGITYSGSFLKSDFRSAFNAIEGNHMDV